MYMNLKTSKNVSFFLSKNLNKFSGAYTADWKGESSSNWLQKNNLWTKIKSGAVYSWIELDFITLKIVLIYFCFSISGVL